jgi:hypothetical protein
MFVSQTATSHMSRETQGPPVHCSHSFQVLLHPPKGTPDDLAHLLLALVVRGFLSTRGAAAAAPERAYQIGDLPLQRRETSVHNGFHVAARMSPSSPLDVAQGLGHMSLLGAVDARVAPYKESRACPAPPPLTVDNHQTSFTVALVPAAEVRPDPMRVLAVPDDC